MKNLIIHPETKAQIDSIIKSTPHAVMLTGGDSSGKRTLAQYIATAILNSPVDTHPYFLCIEPDKNSVTIDQIRELKRFTRLKTTGTGRIRRIAVIIEAHLMTTEAQNALLKLLEEPPADTALILTAVGDQSMKPTIYSRVQRIAIRPVQYDQAKEYAATHGKANQADRAYALSMGDAGLFVALVADDDTHPLTSAIQEAKTLLTVSAFERLAHIDTLVKDKEALSQLLVALKRIASAALKTAIEKEDGKLEKRWLAALESVYECEKHTATNANTKLLLTDLFLRI